MLVRQMDGGMAASRDDKTAVAKADQKVAR